MSARNTMKQGQNLIYGFRLVFDANGGVRLTRGAGSLKRGERAVFVEATLPKSLFTTPELRATITVPDTDMTAATFDLVAGAKALKGALGVDIDLQVKE